MHENKYHFNLNNIVNFQDLSWKFDFLQNTYRNMELYYRKMEM